jgi:hypothetical protein
LGVGDLRFKFSRPTIYNKGLWRFYREPFFFCATKVFETLGDNEWVKEIYKKAADEAENCRSLWGVDV